MSDLKTALRSLFDGKPADFKYTLNSILMQKVGYQIDIAQKTMASSWLNNEPDTETENAEV